MVHRRSSHVVFLLLAGCQLKRSIQACDSPGWVRLHETLRIAYDNTDYTNEFLSEVVDLTDASPGMAWYKQDYPNCVEGFLSLVLYFSIHNKARQKELLSLASSTARELNPLALRSGLSKWPFFGLLNKINLLWQDGEKVSALATEPWRLSMCQATPVPSVITPLISALAAGTANVSPFSLVHGLGPGSLVIDAGVFDGTDWSLFSVAAGATVIGFEPMPTNRQLIKERFPAALEELRPGVQRNADGATCRRHTFLDVRPGEAVPRTVWADTFPTAASNKLQSGDSAPQCDNDAVTGTAMGHTFIVGAALGERVRGLNMTRRYDYSSVADQGYLKGPKDMQPEQVAMTTLDEIFGTYLARDGRQPSHGINVLKLDVEGYEMGALRGAEQLIAEGRIHYLVLEFHPVMLGSTGTDPLGLLEFVRHYCFLCHSLKIQQPFSLSDFVARFISDAEVLPLQGLGAIEDLVCQNLYWRKPPPLAPRGQRTWDFQL